VAAGIFGIDCLESLLQIFACKPPASLWLICSLSAGATTTTWLLLPQSLLQAVAGISSFLPDLTVGLIATLTTVACIIAADTGAYFVGKNLGRTKLTDISPKKTVEGALGGLASAVAVAVLFWKLFSWPGNVLAAAGYGVSGAVF
jgi:phosphatidate cytidylyltransferase